MSELDKLKQKRAGLVKKLGSDAGDIRTKRV